ncbi:MAG: cation:proton antiporter [Burkholderiaceae bacterium]
MGSDAEFLSGLGAILLVGLASDFVGRWTVLPRVTLLLLVGVLVGNQALDLIPGSLEQSFPLIANMTLMLIGFLLGGKLTWAVLKKNGRQLVLVSLLAALGTVLFVAFVLVALGLPYPVAILLGCIASATDPAATLDSVVESGRETAFSRLLLQIVAVDDIWALVFFSVAIALVSVTGESFGLLHAARDIFGATLLGACLGVPAAYLTGRIKPGQPMLIEALGLVLVCGGIALWLDVSFIIATMVMGMCIANLARHHEVPFHEIENIEWPFMLVFFVLAGASLQLEAIPAIGLIGVIYLLARIVGKVLGARLGGILSTAPAPVQQWMGVALLPQAGVAIGLALIAGEHFPDHRQLILNVVTSTTILFELLGPIATRVALKRADTTLEG